MSEDAFDCQGWLDRIGYTGPLEPTRAVLDRLILAHATTVAYETLDIMLGRTPRLDLGALQEKMIRGGRGGYCFEQNTLFREGLRALGYRITSLQGRFVRGLAIDAPRPAIHMLIRVDLAEGAFLADVGLGNLAPTCALRLAPEIQQPTPHETVRFVDVGGELTLQARIAGGWEHVYRVIPHPRYDADYEVANWYAATHPGGPYHANIIAAMPLANGARLTLWNERFTERARDGSEKRRMLESEEDFREVLCDRFGLALSDDDVARCVARMREGNPEAPAHPFFA